MDLMLSDSRGVLEICPHSLYFSQNTLIMFDSHGVPVICLHSLCFSQNTLMPSDSHGVPVICLHSFFFSQNTLMLSGSCGFPVICFLFLDLARFSIIAFPISAVPKLPNWCRFQLCHIFHTALLSCLTNTYFLAVETSFSAFIAPFSNMALPQRSNAKS